MLVQAAIKKMNAMDRDDPKNLVVSTGTRIDVFFIFAMI